MVAPTPTPSSTSPAPTPPRGVATARDFDDADHDQGAPLLEALLAAPPRPSRLGLPPGAAPVAEGSAVLMLLAIAAALVGAQAGASGSWVRLFDNLHWTVADCGAAWLAWIGVRDARVRGLRDLAVARRWFALGFTSYAIGQMLWNLQVALSWRPFPAPSDAFYVLLAPCCATGLLVFLRGRVGPAQRLAAVLDTASLAIAVVVLALVIYLPERGATSATGLGVMIAYPSLLLSTACVGLMGVALLRADRRWPAWTLIAMLAAHGGLWMVWNALTLRGALADGGVVNALFSVCTLAGGLAVSCWRVEATGSVRTERFYEGALRVLPLVVVVAVAFAVMLNQGVERLPPAARLACDAAAALVIVLAAMRQTLLLRDRDQLIEAQLQLRDREEQLQHLNQHLEQRVSDRTREAEQRNAELSTALQQLAMAQHELVRAGKLAGLGSLVAGVAGELGTALGNASMLAATLPDDHRQLTQTIEQAQRVVVGFQQVAADQTSDQRREFDLLATVREVVDLTRLAHRHDPVEIIVTGEPELVVDSYPGPIGQVLAQLIENAVVHGFADHRDGSIDVRVWPSGRDAVRITVHDNGIGIPAADLPQVFAPFFTTRLAQGGSGLGLTICRNMVSGILGGRIEIVSPEEGGTTVTLTLPRWAPRVY